MARCFPDNPDDLPPMTSGVINFWKLVKSLPDNCTAWIRLQPQPGIHEFLILLDDDKPLYLAHIISEDHLDRAAQCLREVKTACGCPVGLISKSQPSGGLFAESRRGIPFWGQTELKSADSFFRAIVPYACQPKEDGVIKRLRATIAPEVVVPAISVSRCAINEVARPTTDLTDYALDYQQEDILKKDIILSSEGEAVLHALHSRVITGVAGSGKSLVLIHRVKLLTDLNPNTSCQVLTYNHALHHDLELRFQRIHKKTCSSVRWKTFYKWCFDELRAMGCYINVNKHILPVWKRRELLQKVHKEKLTDEASISVAMLDDELNWIRDNLTYSKNDYFDADRQGRGFGLTKIQREKVYNALQEFNVQRKQLGYNYDWSDIPWQVWRMLEKGEKLTRHDIILIDEAQFFSPIAFELIRRAIKPGGHIFLSADPTQGFLKRRLSWLSMGIDIRGRSHRLRQCYRTTRSILEFASAFYRARLGDDDQENDFSDTQSRANMIPGKPPIIEAVDSRQMEQAYVISEVGKMLAAGARPQDILILHSDAGALAYFSAFLAKKCPGTPVVNLKKRENFTGKELRLCNLSAATGLEAAIVFVMGAGTLLEQEDCLDLTPEDKAELLRNNTRRLYMAFTRASMRLIVTLPKHYARNIWFSP